MIDNVILRRYSESDESALLALNQSVVELTSPLDSRLQLLQSQGCQITVSEHAGDTVGFLMCFAEGSDYDSSNYQWFNHRIRQFLYIDRVVVSQKCRGLGIGQQFYRYLKDDAARTGKLWLAAEINSKPPNTGSMEFHRKQGFVETGEQVIGDKTVSMQMCCL